MIKKIIFAIALSFSLQWVTAQTVSDDQVVRIIMAEKERGADEADIARKLLQQGATPAQIRRIKEKYEQEQNGLGAVDIVGKGEKNSRLRRRMAILWFQRRRRTPSRNLRRIKQRKRSRKCRRIWHFLTLIL